MNTVKDGDTVKIEFTGTLEDGSEFDCNVGGEPLEFTLGQGKMMPGLERAVLGMAEGESGSVVIAPEEAFGPRLDELVFEELRSAFPDDQELVVGMTIVAEGPNGEQIPLHLVELGEETVKLDANHPLAGENLQFELKVLELRTGSKIILA